MIFNVVFVTMYAFWVYNNKSKTLADGCHIAV